MDCIATRRAAALHKARMSTVVSSQAGPACEGRARGSLPMARRALLAALLALSLACGAAAAATPPASEDWVAASAVFEARCALHAPARAGAAPCAAWQR